MNTEPTSRMKGNGFVALLAMYATTYFGEGLLIMYLFNNVRDNGLNIGISAVFSLVSYLPSLILAGVAVAAHSRLSVRSRVLLISVARATTCLALVASGAYMTIWVTIIFIAVMEVLWYALMPCFDELENATVHSIGAGRGEAALTVTLQTALAISLVVGGVLFDVFGAQAVLLILAAMQMVPVVVYPRRHRTATQQDAFGAGAEVTQRQRSPGLAPLFVVLGVAAAVPLLVNILFPVKVFAVTESSAVAGGIDAAYNLGALTIALIGLGALVHRLPVRALGLATMLLAAGILVWFAVATSPTALTAAYLLLGFVTTLCRVRVRAEIFTRIRGAGAGPWYSRITNITLACCAAGTAIVGVVGLFTSLFWCYAVIVVVAFIGAIAAGAIVPPGREFAHPRRDQHEPTLDSH